LIGFFFSVSRCQFSKVSRLSHRTVLYRYVVKSPESP
jgi:hypothetical protein